ncbi:MAG: dihydroorotase [Bacteroidales bacterium]|jgi:dihydroorotase|nr:dihydroorotase [Bacteroidales bacterium]
MEVCNNYFIYNVFVVNEGKVFCADVLIRRGKIVHVMKKGLAVEDLFIEDDTVFIDATNKYLLPGVIDEHVHFREPGLSYKGDMYSESRAAVAGGVTSIMDMPNVSPQTITNDLLDEKYHLAKGKMFTNYSFYLGATNHNIEQIRQADTSRICGVKLFMGSSTGDMLVSDDKILHELFQIQTLPIAVHCEDETIIANNMQQAKKHYGEHVPIEEHVKIRSEEACFVSTQKAVALAQQYGTKLHILHLSTAKELTLLTNQYPNISAEVCAAYLYLDENDYSCLGTKMKCNPSIKQSSDKTALLEALLSERIVTIASDHAPHTREEKENTYFKAPSGIPMVQHSLLLMLELYKEKKIQLQTIVNCMSHAPARIYGIEQRGFIREGYFADLVLVDMEQETDINTDTIHYKCKWSPFEGKKLHARIDKTFVNGELVYDDGIFSASPYGQALQFKRT